MCYFLCRALPFTFCNPRILTRRNNNKKKCCRHSFVFNCPAPSQEPLNRMRRSLVLHSYQFVDPKPLPLCCPERNISKSIKRVTGFGCEEKEQAENVTNVKTGKEGNTWWLWAQKISGYFDMTAFLFLWNKFEYFEINLGHGFIIGRKEIGSWKSTSWEPLI